MSSTISHQIKHRDNPKDVFYTPVELARKHIALVPAQEGDRWFDPFYGTGNYYNNFPTTNRDMTEIAMGLDFFAYSDPVDIICSNPPYSCLDRVLQKCVDLNPRVISLMLLHGSITTKRMEFLKEHGYAPASIYHAKVFKWYGMSEAWTFIKSDNWNNCAIHFDRIVYR